VNCSLLELQNCSLLKVTEHGNGGRGRNAAPTQRPAGEGLRQQATEATTTGVAAGMPLLRSGWRERGFGSKLPEQRRRGSRQECRSYAAVGGRGASAASYRSNDDGGRGRNAAPTQRLAGEGLRQQATEATKTGVAAGMPLLRSGRRERGFGSRLPKQRKRGSRQECRSYAAVGGRGASAVSCRSNENGGRGRNAAPTQRLAGEGLRQQAAGATTTGVAAGMPLLHSGWRERGFGSKLPKQRRRGSRQECRSYAAVGGRGASAVSYRSNDDGGRGRNAAPTQRLAGEGLRQQATGARKGIAPRTGLPQA